MKLKLVKYKRPYVCFLLPRPCLFCDVSAITIKLVSFDIDEDVNIVPTKFEFAFSCSLRSFPFRFHQE